MKALLLHVASMENTNITKCMRRTPCLCNIHNRSHQESCLITKENFQESKSKKKKIRAELLSPSKPGGWWWGSGLGVGVLWNTEVNNVCQPVLQLQILPYKLKRATSTKFREALDLEVYLSTQQGKPRQQSLTNQEDRRGRTSRRTIRD